MIKFRGYTLSEILIALLVLGIIVSASVPVIMKLAPNKNVAMIKKAYYITESIVNGLINDPYYYPDNSIHCKDGTTSSQSLNPATGGTCYFGFDDLRAVKVENINYTTAPGDADAKFRCLFASKLNIKEDLISICNGTINEVTTMDGMTWNFASLNAAYNNSTIQIDVDGKNNGVHAYSKTTGKGLCEDVDDWSITVCDEELTPRIKKNFDRIEINIQRDGKISISNPQEDFINIISGKKKVISGDDD